MIYDNSDRYVGEFKAGKRHGKGAYYYHDGSKYEGEYRNGKRAGKGTYTSVHGDKYFGEWKDGESHGEGVYQYVNGDRFEGEFRDDVPHGKGTLLATPLRNLFALCVVYSCSLLGTYRHANGDTYEGEFQNGFRHGKGRSVKANGGALSIYATNHSTIASPPSFLHLPSIQLRAVLCAFVVFRSVCFYRSFSFEMFLLLLGIFLWLLCCSLSGTDGTLCRFL